MVVNTTKMIRTMKILLILLLTVALACGTAIALRLKDVWNNPENAFGNNANFVVTDDSGVVHKYNEGVISFAIIGLDSDEVRESDNMGYRSDVIMVCVVDTDTNQASIVSIPRDTKARVQVLNSDGKPTNMITTRINAAFSYGFSPDRYGYQNTLDAVNTLFNSSGVSIQPISSYIGVDMDDFVRVADLMGGVDLQLEQDVPGFGTEGQTIHLEGDKALEYVRIRKGEGLTGMDTDRTARQRGFMKAVAKKMQSMDAMEIIPTLYNECIKGDIIDTNLTMKQIYALASSINGINFDDVMFEMLPGYINDAEGEGYWHVNTSQLKTMILDLFYNATEETSHVPVETTTEITTADDGYSKKTEYNYTSKKKNTGSSTSSTKKKTSKKTNSNNDDDSDSDEKTTKDVTKTTTEDNTKKTTTEKTTSETKNNTEEDPNSLSEE